MPVFCLLFDRPFPAPRWFYSLVLSGYFVLPSFLFNDLIRFISCTTNRTLFFSKPFVVHMYRYMCVQERRHLALFRKYIFIHDVCTRLIFFGHCTILWLSVKNMAMSSYIYYVSKCSILPYYKYCLGLFTEISMASMCSPLLLYFKIYCIHLQRFAQDIGYITAWIILLSISCKVK